MASGLYTCAVIMGFGTALQDDQPAWKKYDFVVSLIFVFLMVITSSRLLLRVAFDIGRILCPKTGYHPKAGIDFLISAKAIFTQEINGKHPNREYFVYSHSSFMVA